LVSGSVSLVLGAGLGVFFFLQKNGCIIRYLPKPETITGKRGEGFPH
jgi:hypothetical protein